MIFNMKSSPLFGSINQIEDFLNTNKQCGFKFEIKSKSDKYEFVSKTLWDVRYRTLSKREKHTVLRYLKCFTQYSKGHLKKLADKWRKGALAFNPGRKRNKFSRKYFANDIALLIKTDVAHSCLSAKATKRILVREYTIFKNADYANISNISTGHIYNIRNNNRQYNSSDAMCFNGTKKSQTDIGIRQKPRPDGKPGYVRVDTVHQGDLCGNKGVYHINIVDEVTQFELIATVGRISEHFLKPVIEMLLELFPFTIIEFHSDNGSEYINRWVAELLNKIHVRLTKSRSRHSNDNALVESKNGSIIRKMFGRNYINKKWANEINGFDKEHFNIYLDYHRPCAFATDKQDSKGKIRKVYDQWLTPYEKFKSLPNAEQYLKPEFNFAALDKIAYAKSDNQFAEKMNKVKKTLFRKIAKDDVYQKIRDTQIKKKNPLDWISLKD